MEKVIVCTIADSLTVLKNMLDVSVIKETLNENAAFVSVRVDFEKRGYFFSVFT
ncbi:MAG: hypothetical protein IJK58_01935 [Clostridia bacterium]|nr:hypothetical protein [Clostridia bacterium]